MEAAAAMSPFSSVLRDFMIENLSNQLPGNESSPIASILYPEKIYLSARLIIDQIRRGKSRIKHITHLVIVHDKEEILPPEIAVLQKTCMTEKEVMTHADEIEGFLREALDDPASKVVVLCNAGEVRSATAVCEFLRRYTGLDIESVFDFVKTQRPVVDKGILDRCLSLK
jgi:hypothetical protein